MKNTKAIIMLVLALATGLAAAIVAAGWVSQKTTIISTKVVVAAVDIELGSKITPLMLSTVDWPSTLLPSGAFKDTKMLEDRVLKVSVLRGEPFLEGKLTPVGTLSGLSAVISEGKRAMTVRVNDVVGVAGFALPGTFVDVMVNMQKEKENASSEDQQISKTVLEHVLVLASAQEAGRDDNKPKVVSAVTLELTLEDAEKLDLARNVGSLSLVLRNQFDKKTVETKGITKKQLFGIEEKPISKPVIVERSASRALLITQVNDESQCVEVIQNGTKSLSCFKQ